MTRLQRRNLQIWLKFRDKPMSFAALFWANRRTYLLMFISFSLLGLVAYNTFGWAGAGYLVVAFIIAVARDLGYFIRSARAWPVLRQAIDWTRVETLLQHEAPPKT